MEFIITKEMEEKIAKAADLEEVVQICKAEGVEITKEELEAAIAQQKTEAELDENALDEVAGGMSGIIVGPSFHIVRTVAKLILFVAKRK